MKRFVFLRFPFWPVDRMRRVSPWLIDDDRPTVLVTSAARGIEITAANVRAATEGLWVGQALADARAMVPAVRSLPAEPEADAAALEALAQWCGRYGPWRNVCGKDGIWIDVTGVAHLFGGEAGLLSDIVQRIEGLGMTVRAGMADTFAAAYALARFGAFGKKRCFCILGSGCMQTALASFPVEALRLDAQAVLLLKRLGLRRIGQLYEIPRSSLQRRFNDANFRRGKSGKGQRKIGAADLAVSVLARLDQALGRAAEPLKPLAEPPVLSVCQSWTDPLISAEGIAAGVRMLAGRLVDQLEAQGLGCRKVRLSLYRSDGTTAVVRAGTSLACRDADHLMRLISEKLGDIDAGFGIDVAEIDAVAVEPMRATQQRLGVGQGENAGEVRALTELVDRLVNRFGNARVQMLEPCESHIPERAEYALPARDLATGERSRDRPGAPGSKSVQRLRTPHPPRPLLLLRPPEPISVKEDALCKDPVSFVWRRVAHRVLRSAGPERIAPEWWRNIGRAAARQERGRDYYCVEAAGGARFWIFRELGETGEGGKEGTASPEASAAGRWFLHGVYGGHP